MRRLKRQRNHLIRERLGTALAESSYSDFWKEVRKINKANKGHAQTASQIDGFFNDKVISQNFATKIRTILNSEKSIDGHNDLANLVESLSVDDLKSTFVSPGVVSEAFSRIKPGKSDGSDLFSNHYTCAAPVLTSFLSNMFTIMLRHGYIPKCLRDCVLQPIPKPGKDPSDSENYRAIALAPILSKVFEWCLLLDNKSAFSTSSLQFGFKQGLSTDLCTGLVKNVIARYTFNETDVYGCFLDASKAFDRVNHSRLFDKLIKRNLPPVVVRALLSWYNNQHVSVRWKSCYSDSFSVANGVRQGGVLSPILFTVYIDDLLLQLEKAGIGCFWNHHYVGAVCYADDIALLAPSPSALRLMLRTCSDFAQHHSLTFNATKTQLIKFSRCSSLSTAEFTFCGHKLAFSEHVTHLGHILSGNLTDDADIASIKKDMCQKANYMLYTFAPCDPFTKSRLLESFCMTLYGSALWPSSSAALRLLEVAFNNIVRKIWSLPHHCHTAPLHLLVGIPSIFNTVLSRSGKLIVSALRSASPVVMDVFTDCINLVYTSAGYNLHYGHKFWKQYTDQHLLTAKVIFDIQSAPKLNIDFLNELKSICCE